VGNARNVNDVDNVGNMDNGDWGRRHSAEDNEGVERSAALRGLSMTTPP